MLIGVSGPLTSFQTGQLETWETRSVSYLEYMTRRRTFRVAIADTKPRIHVRINPFIVGHSINTTIPYEPINGH